MVESTSAEATLFVIITRTLSDGLSSKVQRPNTNPIRIVTTKKAPLFFDSLWFYTDLTVFHPHGDVRLCSGFFGRFCLFSRFFGRFDQQPLFGDRHVKLLQSRAVFVFVWFQHATDFVADVHAALADV